MPEGSRHPPASSFTAPAIRARDQSYFLFRTTPEQLSFLRFPLGDLAKAETRDLARRLDLPVADKPDSQDICFVPDGDYARTVERLRPDAAVPGDIVHVDGRRLGAHRGVAAYTVGQRRGLGVSAQERLYVVGIDAGERRVTVGPRRAGYCAEMALEDMNWLDGAAARLRRHRGDGEAPLQRGRGAGPAAPARGRAGGPASPSRSPAWLRARPASPMPARAFWAAAGSSRHRGSQGTPGRLDSAGACP